MKTIYIIAAIILGAALYALNATRPGAGDKPVLYWSTWPTPIRQKQIQIFHEWLKKKGYPDIDLKIDFDSGGGKGIIQGVSGVGADLMGSGSQGSLRFLKDAGLLIDLTDDAKKNGYGPGAFCPRIEADLFIDGRQYAYPAMIATIVFMYNKTVFKELGMAEPPRRLDFETFERIGREFLAKTAAPQGQKRTRYFCQGVAPGPMWKSLGAEVYNETMTASTLDDERVVRILEMVKRWADEGIIMSKSDFGSLTAAGGTASTFGPRLYNFQKGKIAVIMGGRYIFQGIRVCGKVDMGVMEFPNGGFPNTWQNPVSISVYAGSKYKQEALRFMEFLGSEDYNMSVADLCDGETPNMKYAHTDRFLKPAEYPGEWDAHQAILEIAESIGIPIPCSPYIDTGLADNICNMMTDKVDSGVADAKTAAKEAQTRINAEIRQTLKDRPELKVAYDAAVKRQKEIERLRADGKKVPLSMIDNPFYKAYYKFKGWGE